MSYKTLKDLALMGFSDFTSSSCSVSLCFQLHLCYYYSFNTPSSFPFMSPCSSLRGSSPRCLHNLLCHFIQTLFKCHLLNNSVPDHSTLKQPVLFLQPTLVFRRALVITYLFSHWNLSSLMPGLLSLLFSSVLQHLEHCLGHNRGLKNTGGSLNG